MVVVVLSVFTNDLFTHTLDNTFTALVAPRILPIIFEAIEWAENFSDLIYFNKER